MRLTTMFQVAAFLAMAGVPTLAAAAPVRAASALPSGRVLGTIKAPRAATPDAQASSLVGFPIAIFVALFGAAAVVAVVVSGPRRSPG